ncbi:MAG: hypothetical protein JW744_02145, partial [Candidatus Diapherotrites archaeon]|nr:hypothetical protein [Candidatus Diapherotrites archaeon]
DNSLLRRAGHFGKRLLGRDQMKHKRMMKFLKKRLREKGFFESLPDLGGPPYGNMKACDLGGFELAIKNTFGFKEHGSDFKKFRSVFLAHQMAVKEGRLNPQHYILKSIKVYGKIGNFLVMQRVKEKPVAEMGYAEKTSFETARSEVKKNFEELFAEHEIKRPPQTRKHVLAVENTKPQQPEKGKWVVCLPYDFE